VLVIFMLILGIGGNTATLSADNRRQ